MTDNRDVFYASVRAIEALCLACKQPQNAPSCERREHWDGYPTKAGPWVAERGARMPSGKYWWVVKHSVTGKVCWATGRKGHAENYASRLNAELDSEGCIGLGLHHPTCNAIRNGGECDYGHAYEEASR